MNIITKLYNKFIKSGDARYYNIKINVLWSFMIKGVSIIISLIKIPIILSYLNPEKYGVWLTIASIVMWVSHFDMGLGHGLRNKLTEAIAKNESNRVDGLLSTAYFSMGAIMLGFVMLLTPIVLYLDWNDLLNVTGINEEELKYTILLTLIMFCARFVFKLISTILKSIQKSAISDSFLPIESALALIIIIVLKYTYPDSLLLASAALSVTPVLVLVAANIIFLKRFFSEYRLSVFKVKKIYFWDIYSLGFKFFIGQICALIIFSSQNFIISNVVNPEEVTVYNIARTYFTLPITFLALILTPYWSAITEAYTKGEYDWIRRNMNKLFRISGTCVVGLVLMLLFSQIVFKLWIGTEVIIPVALSVSMMLYNSFVAFLSPISYFINGVGKLSFGLYVGLSKTIIYLPVALYLTKLYGAVGIIVALFLVNIIPSLIFETLQYRKIINRTASGIWNR